uniref:BHLH domain-containing protein n=2 Tax=Oryza brachyantha TaxID=4533 RepID=J3MY92_ORYBR
MDKAALLGEVVRYVRDLRSESGRAAAGAVVPGEVDEVIVEEEEEQGSRRSCDAGEKAKRVQARMCCDDRPGLMTELGNAVRSVGTRAVRADIATVGGRIRSVLELDVTQTAAGGDNVASLPALQAALRAVIISREELLAMEGYKRRRFSSHFCKET